MDLLYLRAIGLPFVLVCGVIALAVIRGRMASPVRGFLLQFWGSSLLLFAEVAVCAALLWADTTPARMASDARFDLIVGGCAILCLALGLALGWRIRMEGERFLTALVRPPASVNSRSLQGRPILPLAFLWLALVLGVFAMTYGGLSYATLAGPFSAGIIR